MKCFPCQSPVLASFAIALCSQSCQREEGRGQKSDAEPVQGGCWTLAFEALVVKQKLHITIQAVQAGTWEGGLLPN